MISDCFCGRWDSIRIARFCAALSQRYPFISLDSVGTSVTGTCIPVLTLGKGSHRVLFHGAHHANEGITAPLLLRFVSELAAACEQRSELCNISARGLLEHVTLAVIPAVNPDGIDLVCGKLSCGPFYERALEIAYAFPDIPFPAGWKANLEGIDLNLQYPAGWEQAKQNKAALGFDRPAPRDFVGTAPLCAPESRALYRYTLRYSPRLTLSYHTQGREIYWQYLNHAPDISVKIAEDFSLCSGYRVADVPFSSGFAGYKDWFLQEFGLPGFTIEAGLGQNPLPMTSLEQLFGENLGIFVRAMQPFIV